ncbi:MAG: hypothetical protein IPH95_15790 [Candidatus Promineofilum sp.]|nr:hypothetical protein [Promineifilum sp.]
MQAFMTEFSHTLRRLRGQVIGWGIGLALYGLLMGGIYSTLSRPSSAWKRCWPATRRRSWPSSAT